MKKCLITVVFICALLPVIAQNWHERDSLLKVLAKTGLDTARTQTLLRLAEFEVFKPGEFKADLDSGETYLHQAKTINKKLNSELVNAHIATAESHLEKERGQTAPARASAEKAIQIFQKRADKYQLGQAYIVLSECYNYSDATELNKKIQIVKQAANEFKQGGYSEREAYCYEVIAELDPDATQTFADIKVALALYQSIHYTALQSVYDVFGSTYSWTGDYKQALTYFLKALDAAKSHRDTTMQLCEINNHIGIVYYQLNDFKVAVKYFEASIVTAKALKDAQTVFMLTGNIGDCYMGIGKPQEALKALKSTLAEYPLPANAFATDSRFVVKILRAYVALKQFNLAKPYAEHLLSWINNNQIAKQEQCDTYLDLIRYYFASKQYPQMLSCLTKDDILSRQYGSPLNVEIIHMMWFQMDTAQNNYKDAVKHLLINREIRDSLFTQKKGKQIQQLEVQFDTKQKEDQIKLLNQKGELDKSKVDRANLERNVTEGAIALVLIIAGLLYKQSRQRKKNNQFVNQKNAQLQSLVTEKEWLLKEVHHRVKNNLHTVICLLESQARYLENDALKAIENSQHRIYAMSLIHQQLYQSEDIKTIDMAEYIPQLVKSLEESFGSSDQIKFNLKIDPASLDISHAIPLGLIINESITNSIKYAFPNKRKGEISISLLNEKDGIKLELADNGIGMPHIDPDNEPESLGLRLMKGLSEDIDAVISFEVDNGTRISITFGYDTLNEPENILKVPQTKEIYV